jgi:nicotinamidase-related amidase
MAKKALLIIDMQNDFVRDGAPLQVAQAKSVVPNISAVLREFRERNLPVFHIVRVHRADGSDVEIIRQSLFQHQPFAVEGTNGAAIINELSPLPGEYVIKKTRMSAFIGTELDLMLRTLKVTTLVVTGIQTPNCVRTTVFDAIAYNYLVVVIEDAVGAKTDAIHAANLLDMANIGVRVVRASDIVAVLSG